MLKQITIELLSSRYLSTTVVYSRRRLKDQCSNDFDLLIVFWAIDLYRLTSSSLDETTEFNS